MRQNNVCFRPAREIINYKMKFQPDLWETIKKIRWSGDLMQFKNLFENNTK